MNTRASLAGHLPPGAGLAPAPQAGRSTWWPGPLVRKLLAVAFVACVVSGALAAWLVSYTTGQEAVQRLVEQQNDEVELIARLLSSKIEQSQKVLASVAGGITPAMLDSPSSLEWLLRQGFPAVRFFDAIQVARQDGRLSVNLRNGQQEPPAKLDPQEREYLRRTLVEGKPLVSDVIGSSPGDARVMFTMPLLRGEGQVAGAIAGVLRLQSQGLLPQSLALPVRSASRVIVFTREGVILAHPRLERVLGLVRDEPGLGAAWQRCCADVPVLPTGGVAQQQGDDVVSLAGVPLPQWVVARVSDAQALHEPLRGAQYHAWRAGLSVAVATGVLALAWMLWLARPLAQLRQRAQALLAQRDLPAAQNFLEPQSPWPRSHGEVDDVVRACLRLLEERRAQQDGSDQLGQQLQAVLGHAPLGIAVTRQERVEVASAQVCQLLGYTPEQLQGRNLMTLLAAPRGVEHVAARVRAAFAAHGSFDGELALAHHDGATQWVRVQGQPIDPGQAQQGTVWVLEDCTATRAERQQQGWERWHDVLTYLPNRALCERRLQVLLSERSERAERLRRNPSREGAPGVLLFLDVDHFTVINDVAGHHAGDDVLRHLARLLQAQVRQSGWVARLGGDEFAVVLPGSTRARGLAWAEQLRAAVQAWEPSYHGRSFTLGLSIGLVALELGMNDVAALFYQADMACYAAKRAGRNRVEIYRPPEPERGTG